MSTRPDALTRMMSTAALLAALGLPMAACAQTPQVTAPTGSQTSTQPTQAAAAAAEAAESAETAEEAVEEVDAEQAEKDAIAAEMEELQTQQRLNAARLAAELAPLNEEKQRLEAEISILRARQSAENARRQLEKDQADFEQQMAMAETARAVQLLQAQMQAIQAEQGLAAAQRSAELAELQAQNQALAAESAALQAELSAIQARNNYNAIDRDAMQYPANPLDGQTLTISDRRIPLNGAIGSGMADYITQRIHYFNNLNSEAPIFIVIDGSPGGSVMEGFRIVTAMQNSDAPIHVVVKSYAASMAAVITTLAEESYCYPNALILHHQMSSGMSGNLTQQRESLEEGYEWAARLANPVAEKMGVTPERFVELMYENNSDGDWGEFGDVAVDLKWCNHVVTEINETAITTAPGSSASRTARVYAQADDQPYAGFTQEDLFTCPIQYETVTDGNGKSYVALPRLVPGDLYYIANPDNYYRIAQ
ncbi:MAG: ATP-dependent Clp protease proteolytic subunit [Phycisphaerales bacterium JB063]